MSKPDHPDDFEAVRAIVQALEPFERGDQERILRWAREKVGLATGSAAPASNLATAVAEIRQQQGSGLDIKTFVGKKIPQSDTHFAATVAYYYRFEAPEALRKDAISSEDLQEASRQVNRGRFKRPIVTLSNAHRDGLLDKADRGTYRINSVGENLVAMALPAPTGTTPLKRKQKVKVAKKKVKAKAKK